MRRLAILFVFLLVISACGDDDGAAVSQSDVPPWGLTEVDMPDTQEDIEALFAALPCEIAGLPRADMSQGRGGPAVHYGAEEEQGLVLDAFSVEQAAAAGGREAITPLEFLSAIASEMGELEGSSLDPSGPLVWVAAGGTAETGPGVVETDYLAVWGEPEGAWVFQVTASSAEARNSLIHAFVDAIGS